MHVAETSILKFLLLHECVDSSCSVCNYILWSHTSLCQATRKTKDMDPKPLCPFDQISFSPVEASTPNTSIECIYLGHVVSKGKVQLERSKEGAIKNWPVPRTKKKVRQS